MSDTSSPILASARSAAWKWQVCGLLLLATTINYMDRLALNQSAERVMKEVGFKEDGYAELEAAFAYAFALGAVLFGWLADRVPIRLLYPAVLMAWSAVGFATGLTGSFPELLVCRFLLGFTEAGHWPCALRTTQHILPSNQRAMGNSILQSGAALGAVFTPLLILALPKEPGSWRWPFMIVGGSGLVWVLGWMATVRRTDLTIVRPDASPLPFDVLAVLSVLFGVKTLVKHVPDLPDWMPLAVSVAVSGCGMYFVFRWLLRSVGDDPPGGRDVFLRRFFVLMVLVVAINSIWHFFRAWLPLLLTKSHGYDEDFMNWYMLGYYVSADAGSLCAGAAALFLSRRLLSVHGSRAAVFAGCSVLCLMAAAASMLPAGPWLLGTLLVLGFGSLGLFPCYYSFSQELAPAHQGKVSGTLGCCAWLSMAPVHEAVGDLVKRTGSYSQGMAAVAFAPLAALVVLVLFWSGNPFQRARTSQP